ncbi:hypothetical protein CPB84DRAFT_656197 [Gymnopilus junonius]|uniref:Uncharacterized protein n=1 Tax=Gymnopilus junonius TaxID=109634 RepID=A0A9P5NUZ4_GYMJU|nr:hypothetical protein CPB84DRAFT_656197 [Gymnopilus junonius]
MLGSSSSKATTPADSDPNEDSNLGSETGPSYDSEDSGSSTQSDAEPFDLDIDMLVRRRGDTRFLLSVPRKKFVVQDAYVEVVVDMHQEHHIATGIITEGIDKITPYVPVRFAEGEDGQQVPIPFNNMEDALVTMDAILPRERNHCLMLVEMKTSFLHPDPLKSMVKVCACNGDLTYGRTLSDIPPQKGKAKEEENDENDWKLALKGLQQQLEADRERSRLAEKKLKAKMKRAEEKAKLAEEKAKLAEEKAKLAAEEAKLAAENIKLAAQNIRLAEEKITQLEVDLGRETARAKQAEQDLEVVSAVQAENQRDTDEFIASGCRENTAAYYRIKVRHLVNLVQAQLAYSTISTTKLDERDAIKRWRRYCSTLTNLSFSDKLFKVEQHIRSNRKPEDVTATNGLIASGALAILIDDSSLRAIGDAAAHPGPVTKANERGYRDAIDSILSHAVAVNKPDLERHLKACVDYLLLVSGSSA